MAKKIDTHILAILSACTFDGQRLFLPAEQLARPDYVAVNKVLEANGGKWNKAAKAHVFAENAEDAIEQALATGEFHNVKQDLGQFDTPMGLAGELVDLALIEAGMEVLEPSAGIGNIVVCLLAAGAVVRANEIDTKRRETMLKRTSEYTPGQLMIGDVDFLGVPQRPKFDRVVMNPPFAKQADIDHVTHALGFLKPGGRLVAIMSAGVKFRQNRKTADFKDHLIGEIGDKGMGAKFTFQDVPAGAFRESGTDVNACILVVDV